MRVTGAALIGGDARLSRRSEVRADVGFTLIELTVVVALLALLILIAIPVYTSASDNAQKRTCFMNQHTLQRAAQIYLSLNQNNVAADLAGIVDDAHPVRAQHIVGSTPRCPAGKAPADSRNPTLAEGAYRFDASGTLEPCTRGIMGPHGSFTE